MGYRRTATKTNNVPVKKEEPVPQTKPTTSGNGLKVITDQMKNIVLDNKNPKNDTIESTKKHYSKFINFKI